MAPQATTHQRLPRTITTSSLSALRPLASKHHMASTPSALKQALHSQVTPMHKHCCHPVTTAREMQVIQSLGTLGITSDRVALLALITYLSGKASIIHYKVMQLGHFLTVRLRALKSVIAATRHLLVKASRICTIIKPPKNVKVVSE